MNKYIITFISLMLFSALTMAKPINKEMAQKVAFNFAQQQGLFNSSAIHHSAVDITPNDFQNLYIFRLEGTSKGYGFVIVAGDNIARPILGYSDRNDFPIDNLEQKQNVYDWLKMYDNQIDSARLQEVSQADFIQQQWDQLFDGSSLDQTLGTTPVVGPLLTTNWDQSPRYNNLCPIDNSTNSRSVTGCVATAMAQLMKFWNYPAHGVGSNCYTPSNCDQTCADFENTYYNWSSMPNSLSASSTTTQINAVATLMLHCGVAVEMMYGSNGSGAYTLGMYSGIPTCESAMKTTFRYNPNAYSDYQSNYTYAGWVTKLRTNLNQGMPLIYRGTGSAGGHCFVCDGYATDSSFHFNWGWSGVYNGYFLTSALTPSYDFTSGQGALFNLKPTGNAIAGLSTNNITHNQAVLSWSDPDNSTTSYYQIACNVLDGVSYSDADTLLTSNFRTSSTSSLTLTGLSAETLYGVRVRARKTDGTYTIWSDLHQFSTSVLDIPASLPYRCDFEDNGSNGWVLVNGSQTNKWCIGNATSMNGSKSLYISNNNGTSNAYSNSSSIVYAYRTINITEAGTYGYSFQWKCMGESSWDYMNAALVPSSVNLTAGTNNGFSMTGVPSGCFALANNNQAFQNATTWTEQIGSVEVSTPGTYRIVFFWKNDNSVIHTPAPAIDQVEFKKDAFCPSIEYLGFYRVTYQSNSRTYSYYYDWSNPDDVSSYQVQLLDALGNIIYDTIRNHFEVTFSGLFPGTTYRVQVRAICGDDDFGPWASILHTTPCHSIDAFPYTDNFDSYTSSTVAKTGIQPPCWTLVHQDVAMSNEYKPMIYYASSRAHSGNYSLILNKRGYYAMPLIDTNIQNVQLEMYLCQQLAKYQLEVGILTDPSDYTTFTRVQTINNPTTSPTRVTVDFSSYSGTGRYICFHNILASGNTGDFSCNYIDDLTLTYSVPTNYTITVASNNSSMGSVSGSGTYREGTSVTLTATPYSGYVFERWSDGITTNPRTITVTANTTYTAIFSAAIPETPCTISSFPYADNFDSYTTSTTAKTGYTLPCWTLVHQDVTMTNEYKPMIYYASSRAHSGNYSLILNKRGYYAMPEIDADIRNIRLSMYLCQQMTKYQLQVGVLTNPNDYTTFTLVKTINNSATTPVQVSVDFSSYTGSGKYICFRNILASGYSGDFSCNYIDDLTLTNVTPTPSTYTITAVSNNSSMGTVTGGGSYSQGATATLTATSNAGYSFTRWSDGNTTNPRIVTVTANATYTAIFEAITPEEPCTISTFPYTDNFDTYTTSTTAKTGYTLPCWTLVHQDVTMTNEYKPMIYYASARAHSGNYSLILNKRGYYAMPAVSCPMQEIRLSMYLCQQMTKYQLQVGVLTDPNDYTTFTLVKTINNSTTSSTSVSVDFSNYSGSGRYICFRNILASGYSGDFSCNYIDDLTLTRVEDPCTISTFPYTDNFDSYTTSTTAKTGYTLPCWTLVHQDVAMTNEYKPMIYYASSRAHSGNYSLIINKRGYYAMPAVGTDIRNIRLSMYLCQNLTKYQLQVGVLTDPSDYTTFTLIKTINNSATTPVQVSVDFSSYTGTGRYICFRNILASGYTGDFSCNYIDDLTLSLASDALMEVQDGLDSDNGAVTEPDQQYALNSDFEQELNVYPNPTTGKVTISTKVLKVEVYDYSGRKVASIDNSNEVNLSGMPIGMYTLRITLSDRTEIRRVVKQ